MAGPDDTTRPNRDVPGSGPTKQFVRETLGCSCPDEVFESIRWDTLSVVGVDVLRGIIGEKLLVYLFPVGDVKQMGRNLPALVKAGRDERDIGALNRFRLVLISDQPETLLGVATRLFADLSIVDDRMHLHVVDTETAAPITGPVT